MTRRPVSAAVSERTAKPGPPIVNDEDSARRWELIEIAGQLFSERGYAAVSVRQIAHAAGILGGSLYHHFASKRDLFIEVHRVALERARGHIELEVAKHAEPWARFEAALRAHVMLNLDPNSIVSPITADPSVMHTDMRAELIEERDRFEQLYVELVADLPIPETIDRTVYRLVVLSLLNATRSWYRPGRLSPAEIAQQVIWLVRV